jgi:hypothetical protein
VKTEDLYSPADVKRVREKLAKEQDHLDLATELELSLGRAVLDHKHDSEQFVRGVLLHEVNSFLGKIENAHKRHMNYWCKDVTLAQLLRRLANYLERPVDKRYRHPGWLAKAKTLFNSLNESQKKAVLVELNQSEGSNGKERVALFNKALLTKKFSFATIQTIINNKKGNT